MKLFTIMLVALSLFLSPINVDASKRTYLDGYIQRTVLVEVICDGKRVGYGSGVELGRSRILTAFHVVDTKCDVVIAGEKVELLGVNKELDIALLKSTRKFSKLHIRRPYLGESTVCLGFSKQYFPNVKPLLSVTYGHISTVGLPGDLMRISNHVNAGHSGGACYSREDGSLIGVVVSIHIDVSGKPIPGYSYISVPQKKKE